MNKRYTIITLMAIAVLLIGGIALAETGQGTARETESIGELLPIWSVIPFIGILLSISI